MASETSTATAAATRTTTTPGKNQLRIMVCPWSGSGRTLPNRPPTHDGTVLPYRRTSHSRIAVVLWLLVASRPQAAVEGTTRRPRRTRVGAHEKAPPPRG